MTRARRRPAPTGSDRLRRGINRFRKVPSGSERFRQVPRGVRTVAVLACVIGVLSPVSAQRATPPVDPVPDMRPAEVQRLFDAYVVMQAQETLALSEQQFAQFLPRLKTLQDARRRYQQARQKIIAELQRLTAPRQAGNADETTLKSHLASLHELEEQGTADWRQAHQALDEILDVRQQARFRVFEDQVERRKLELLLRARQNRQALRRERPQ